MAAYLKKAKSAQELANALLADVPKNSPEYIDKMILIAKIYNLGIRSNPRPCMGTVRLRAVEQVLEGSGIRAHMVKVRDARTQKEFNALSFVPPSDYATSAPEKMVADEFDDE